MFYGELSISFKKLRIQVVANDKLTRNQGSAEFQSVRASEKKIYPKIAQDFGPDTRRFEGGAYRAYSPLGATQ
jgi:hypothetical protein